MCLSATETWALGKTPPVLQEAGAPKAAASERNAVLGAEGLPAGWRLAYASLPAPQPARGRCWRPRRFWKAGSDCRGVGRPEGSPSERAGSGRSVRAAGRPPCGAVALAAGRVPRGGRGTSGT